MKLKNREKMKAPFNVATKRFNRVGFHPNLDVSGSMKKKITEAGPGSYNIDISMCRFKKGINWDRELEMRDYSRTLNNKNDKLLEERNYNRTLRGPGSTNIDEGYYKRKSNLKSDNLGFTMTRRFKPTVATITPPPGTYLRDLEKISSIPPKLRTKVPHMEWDGLVNRFRDTNPSYWKAPNRYRPKDPRSLEAVASKVVSNKSPVEFFTGPRDRSTIKNHFGPAIGDSPDVYYVLPSDLDKLLKSPSKQRMGKFLQCVRFLEKPVMRHIMADISLCYKNPSFPGPASYSLMYYKGIKPLEEASPAFGSSVKNWERPYFDHSKDLAPGPGRYTPKISKCTKSKRKSWPFLSKVSRNLFKFDDFSAF